MDSSLFLWPFLPFPRSRYFIFRSVEKKERCSVIILAIWFQIESFVSFPLHTKTADLESISHCNRNKKPWLASSRPARPSLSHACSFSQAESVSSRRHRTISFRPLTKLAVFRVKAVFSVGTAPTFSDKLLEYAVVSCATALDALAHEISCTAICATYCTTVCVANRAFGDISSRVNK